MKILAYVVFGAVALAVSVLLLQPDDDTRQRIEKTREISQPIDGVENKTSLNQDASKEGASTQEPTQAGPRTAPETAMDKGSQTSDSQDSSFNPFGDNPESSVKPFQGQFASPDEPWTATEGEVQPFSSPVPPEEMDWGKPFGDTDLEGFNDGFFRENEEEKTFSLDRKNPRPEFGTAQ